MTETVKIEMWAVVEIMGHKRIAGKVSEEVKFGVPMMRVDVPETKTHKSFVRYFGGGSIHSFTPMDEDSVRRAAEWLDESPSVLPGVIESPMLAGKATAINERDWDSSYEYDELEPDYDDDPDDEDDDWDDENEAIVPTPAPNPLKSIVSMERGETSNSKSPMWRCITLDDEKVNVFKHTDPKKDTFHLFQEAGYGPVMEGMKVGDVLTWKQCPISVMMSKSGTWWEVTRVYQMSPEDKPEVGRDDEKAKLAAAAWAKALIDTGDFVVLDTETTGLDKDLDEPVSIAIIAPDGTMLLDTLVVPKEIIHSDAADIHGIDMNLLTIKNAPPFSLIHHIVHQYTNDKKVITYNAEFDKAMLENAQHSPSVQYFGVQWDCAMLQYAKFYGEWNPHHADYKNQSLSKACEQQGITDIDAPAHSALGDCLRTLALIKKMAAYDLHPF